jgi:hypothetical protein
MKEKTTVFSLIWRFLILVVLYTILFVAGAGILDGKLPDITPEPGLLSGMAGLLLIAAVNTILIMILVNTSRWNGWRLAVLLALAWYGANTFIMQIETWYFLSNITVDSKLLTLLFLMGTPVAFVFVPVAVWVMKGVKTETTQSPLYIVSMPVWQWILKLGAIAVAYVLLYWLAGYFIAWQNPELRAFYGSSGPITPFWEHTLHTLKTDPGLFPFQLLRALIWTLCVLPVLYGSRLNVWPTAILVGIFVSIPQNLGHILENPLIPQASVRLSHLIETASSTFLFGLVVVWLLHRKHSSLKDLFGR